jgi:hypothetical protein
MDGHRRPVRLAHLLVLGVACAKPAAPPEVIVSAPSSSPPVESAPQRAPSKAPPPSSPFRAGKPRSTVLGHHADAVCAVAFSKDGGRLATGAFDGTLRVWSIADGSAIDLPSIKDEVCAVAFGPTGKWLAAGGWDDRIRLIDTSTWKVVRTLDAFAGVKGISFSHDGERLAAVTLKATGSSTSARAPSSAIAAHARRTARRSSGSRSCRRAAIAS